MHWKEQPCCNDSNGRRHKHSQQNYQLPFQPTPRGCYMLTVSLATINRTSLCPQKAHLALLCLHIRGPGIAPCSCLAFHLMLCSLLCYFGIDCSAKSVPPIQWSGRGVWHAAPELVAAQEAQAGEAGNLPDPARQLPSPATTESLSSQHSCNRQGNEASKYDHCL